VAGGYKQFVYSFRPINVGGCKFLAVILKQGKRPVLAIDPVSNFTSIFLNLKKFADNQRASEFSSWHKILRKTAQLLTPGSSAWLC
jgi:hypothetical protein